MVQNRAPGMPTMPVQQGLLQLGVNANAAKSLGQTYLPDLTSIPNSLLQAASPALANIHTVNLDPGGSNAAQCRTYQGLAGLRRLQGDQKNKSVLENGCGWLYKPSASGGAPVVNRGALGSSARPVVGYHGAPDEVAGGTHWLWNLQTAEKTITSAIIGATTKCASMGTIEAQNPGMFGFCKTSGRIIPVQQTSSGVSARYPNDANLGCVSSDIVVDTARCPPQTSGFQNFGGAGAGKSGRGYQGKIDEAFTSLTDNLNDCVSPLTRDCVVNAARQAGCSDQGTLILAMNGPNASIGQQDYGMNLSNQFAFKAYQSNANPAMTKAIFRDGSTSLSTALSDFGNLAGNATNTNKLIATAARELCLSNGAMDTYNFCLDMRDSSIIDENTIGCLQGADPSWIGKSVAAYMASVAVNSQAQEGFVNNISLPQGVETVWIDTVNTNVLTTPIIIGSQLQLDNPSPPVIISSRDLHQRYNMSQHSMAFTSAFEICGPVDTLKFETTSEGGFMVGLNQNPFENTNKNDWGSWRHQSENTYTSPQYNIMKNKKNVVVMKWFQGQGASHVTHILANKPVPLHLTQDPSAPWMQYEICNRPNISLGGSSLQGSATKYGFFEKRWNGPCGYIQGEGKPIPSFDTINTGGVVYQTDYSYCSTIPGKKGCISFHGGTSAWRTLALFAFTAFKTVTLLVRPAGGMNDGEQTQVFSHMDKAGRGVSLYVKRVRENYILTNGQVSVYITPSVWNLIVIQYVADYNNYGVAGFSIHCQSLSTLRDARASKAFVEDLVAKQTISGVTGIPPVTATNKSGAGHLGLGAINGRSFTGDVAWIHGFRNYINTSELLQKEVAQSWASRWPRGEA